MTKTKPTIPHTLLFFLLVSIGIVFSSCKKNEPFNGTFELSGTVRDELTGNPIAYADVRIIERERGWMTALGGKMVGAQKANEKGEFVISFPVNESGYSYEIVATEYNKYFENNSPPRVSFTQTGKGRQDITLMPKGYLTFIIKGNKGGEIMSISYSQFRKGADTSVTFFREPNKNAKYYYSVYDGKGTSTIYGNQMYKDTINITPPPPPDTAFYLIEF